MKTRGLLVLICLLLVPLAAIADDVYGRVWVAGSGAAGNAVIHFTDPNGGAELGTATADKDGGFRTSLAARQYAVYVSFNGDSSRVLIHVSGETRADLELQRTNEGGWLLIAR
jgi:hypothetical protein